MAKLDMNPEIREQWCKALRSGEYTQARKALRETGIGGTHSYCCLGVLTDLYVKAGNPETWEDSGDTYYLWEESTLPEPVLKWAGLDTDNPWLTNSGGGSSSAASWNDEYEAGFEEIADMIDGGPAKQG